VVGEGAGIGKREEVKVGRMRWRKSKSRGWERRSAVKRLSGSFATDSRGKMRGFTCGDHLRDSLEKRMRRGHNSLCDSLLLIFEEVKRKGRGRNALRHNAGGIRKMLECEVALISG